jgi:hypothetical protein
MVSAAFLRDVLRHIAKTGTSVEVEGELKGAARLDARVVVRLWQAMPKGDPLEIEVEGGTLSIGTFSLSGSAVEPPEDVSPTAITPHRADQPLESTLRKQFLTAKSDSERAACLERLALLGHVRDLIELGVLREAEPILSDHQARIKRAAGALARFGVTKGEIEALVRQKMLADLGVENGVRETQQS